jgi:hypothetical protein
MKNGLWSWHFGWASGFSWQNPHNAVRSRKGVEVFIWEGLF